MNTIRINCGLNINCDIFVLIRDDDQLRIGCRRSFSTSPTVSGSGWLSVSGRNRAHRPATTDIQPNIVHGKNAIVFSCDNETIRNDGMIV